MNVYLVNSSLKFATRAAREKMTETSSLYTPTSFYVSTKQIKAGSSQSEKKMYVDVFAVQAGHTYEIKCDSDWIAQTSGLTVAIDATFGTNLLTGTGSITDAETLKSYKTDTEAFTFTYTPTKNGYIYVSQYVKDTYKNHISVYG